MLRTAVIRAPASSTRATIVASRSGTWPSKTREPHVIGTPASAMLSLTPIRLPARRPVGAPPAPDTEWWRLEVTPDDWAEEPPQLLARLLEQLLCKSAHGPGHADAVALHLPMKRHAMESEPGGGARHVSSGVAQCAHDRI